MKQLMKQGPGPHEPGQPVIGPEAQAAFVAAAVRLASRAQFSKDEQLMMAARQVGCWWG